MAYSSDRTISIEQLFESVNRHRYLGALVFLLVFGTVAAAWYLLPREYGSEGRLFVQLGRANHGTTATANNNAGAVSIQDTRETEIRSVAEIIKSETVLGQVVDTVGADDILMNSIQLPIGGGGGTIDGFTAGEYKALRKRERAIKKLSNDLNVFIEKKTSVISVYCTAGTPTLAQEVVKQIMLAVQQSHVQVHSAKRSRDFFDREYERQQLVVADAETELQEFRDTNQFLSVQNARETLNGVIDKLENQMVDVSVDLNQSSAMIIELERQSKDIQRELIMPQSGIESISTAGAQQQLNERRGEKARLLAKYSASNQKVIEINKEIERLERVVLSLPTDVTQSGKMQNPVYEELMVTLVTERSRAKSLESRLQQVEIKHRDALERLVKLNRLETESARCQRKINVAQQELSMYAKKKSEAKIIDRLDNEAISDVVIAQAASLQLKKHSPRGSVMFPLGFIFANLCGLFAAIFADRRRLTGPTTPEEIEDALDIPVLVTIPRVHSSRVQTN